MQSQRWQPQPCLPSPSSSGLFSSHSERRAHPEEKLISFLLSPSFLDRSIPWSVLLSPGSWLGCNHKVIWVGRGFKGHPNLLHGHLPLDQGAPSNLAWNVSRDGESTTPSQKLSPSHLLLPYPITTGPTKSLSPIHEEAVIPIYKGILFYWKSRKRNRGVISLKISTQKYHRCESPQGVRRMPGLFPFPNNGRGEVVLPFTGIALPHYCSH